MAQERSGTEKVVAATVDLTEATLQHGLTVVEAGVDVAAATGKLAQGVTIGTLRGWLDEAREAAAAYAAAIKKASDAIQPGGATGR